MPAVVDATVEAEAEIVAVTVVAGAVAAADEAAIKNTKFGRARERWFSVTTGALLLPALNGLPVIRSRNAVREGVRSRHEH